MRRAPTHVWCITKSRQWYHAIFWSIDGSNMPACAAIFHFRPEEGGRKAQVNRGGICTTCGWHKYFCVKYSNNPYYIQIPPHTHTTIFFHALEDSITLNFFMSKVSFGSSPCGALPSVICTQLTGSCIINYSCIWRYCTAIDTLSFFWDRAWLALKFEITFRLFELWISHSGVSVTFSLSTLFYLLGCRVLLCGPRARQ